MKTAILTRKLLNIHQIESLPLATEPFEHLVIPQIFRNPPVEDMLRDFPPISQTGSFPISHLTYGPVFDCLIQELRQPEFERAVGRRFGLDLSEYETMFTVRGYCSRTSDGHIHTDSKDKVITVLLYLNPEWAEEGGRLRLLRSRDLEDCAVEVPPAFGTMLIFRRCDTSFHGHYPYEGKRLSIQMNWVKSRWYREVQEWRHNLSAWVKTLKK